VPTAWLHVFAFRQSPATWLGKAPPPTVWRAISPMVMRDDVTRQGKVVDAFWYTQRIHEQRSI
jgi:hypothetical protein